VRLVCPRRTFVRRGSSSGGTFVRTAPLLQVRGQRLAALLGLDSGFRGEANHLGADRHACFRVEWLDRAVCGTAIVDLQVTTFAAVRSERPVRCPVPRLRLAVIVPYLDDDWFPPRRAQVRPSDRCNVSPPAPSRLCTVARSHEGRSAADRTGVHGFGVVGGAGLPDDPMQVAAVVDEHGSRPFELVAVAALLRPRHSPSWCGQPARVGRVP
jgi:hypothetical protein